MNPALDTRNPDVSTTFWRFIQLQSRLITTLGMKLRVYGRENIPPTGGALMLSTHQSFWDPVLLGVQIRRPVAFLARDTLFRGHFAHLIRGLNAFPVKQGKGDVGAMKRSIELLRAGWLLNIFPEGRRTADGEIGHILPGAALVVKRAAVPVIPTVIDGAFDSWPIHAKFPRMAKVRVIYGKPILLHDLPSREIVSVVEKRLHELRDEVRSKPEAQ